MKLRKAQLKIKKRGFFKRRTIKSKAIEHYEKSLDLWKDADPGIPENEDAKERIAGLKGQ